MSRSEPHMPELLALHALGATDGDERTAIEAHLSTCAGCRTELDLLAQDAALLGQMSFEVPRAHLRATVLDAIDELAESPASTSVGSPAAIVVPIARPERFRRRRYLPPMLVAASVVLAFGVAVQTVRVNDLQADLNEAQTRTVQVSGQGALSDASINVDFDKGATPIVEFANMPQPPPGKAWQAWSIDADGNISSLGTMERNSRIAALVVDPDAVVVAITLEPTGGSPQPTSDPIARGELKV